MKAHQESEKRNWARMINEQQSDGAMYYRVALEDRGLGERPLSNVAARRVALLDLLHEITIIILVFFIDALGSWKSS